MNDQRLGSSEKYEIWRIGHIKDPANHPDCTYNVCDTLETAELIMKELKKSGLWTDIEIIRETVIRQRIMERINDK